MKEKENTQCPDDEQQGQDFAENITLCVQRALKVKFSQARGKYLTLTLSLGVIPANIADH